MHHYWQMKGGELRYVTHEKDLGRLFCSVQTKNSRLPEVASAEPYFGTVIQTGCINNWQNFLRFLLVIRIWSGRCFGCVIFLQTSTVCVCNVNDLRTVIECHLTSGKKRLVFLNPYCNRYVIFVSFSKKWEVIRYYDITCTDISRLYFRVYPLNW